MSRRTHRTTTTGLALTIAAVFAGAAGIVSLIAGFGGDEGQATGLGFALLLVAALLGLGAAMKR